MFRRWAEVLAALPETTVRAPVELQPTSAWEETNQPTERLSLVVAVVEATLGQMRTVEVTPTEVLLGLRINREIV